LFGWIADTKSNRRRPRRHVRDKLFSQDMRVHGASSTHVTISIGLTSTEPEPERSLESLLREADRALYEAKSAGRNRVVLADVLNDRVAA